MAKVKNIPKLPNGHSFDLFVERCEDCKHATGKWHEGDEVLCEFRILDRLHVMEYQEKPDEFSLDDLDCSTCPPTCLRYTHKGYKHDDRDPPTLDVPGQLTFNTLESEAKDENS